VKHSPSICGINPAHLIALTLSSTVFVTRGFVLFFVRFFVVVISLGIFGTIDRFP
jgi:hypothetical protein